MREASGSCYPPPLSTPRGLLLLSRRRHLSGGDGPPKHTKSVQHCNKIETLDALSDAVAHARGIRQLLPTTFVDATRLVVIIAPPAPQRWRWASKNPISSPIRRINPTPLKYRRFLVGSIVEPLNCRTFSVCSRGPLQTACFLPAFDIKCVPVP